MSIDMNPAKEYFVRIEATDTQRVHDLLSESVGNEISAYEIVLQPNDNGCGCCNDPPCIGCADAIDKQGLSEAEKSALEPNRLHLFSVYTIASDLTESDPVYVMARHEAGAACLFHKARARDHDNTICEVIVSKVQDAEVCDE